MVVKILPGCFLRLHLQTPCQLSELKSIKCKSAKVRKKYNNTNLTLNLILTLIITITVILS